MELYYTPSITCRDMEVRFTELKEAHGVVVYLICMRDCWHSNVPVISVLVCYKTTVIYWHSRDIKTKINADKVEHQGQGFIRAALEVKLCVFDPEAGTLYYQRV